MTSPTAPTPDPVQAWQRLYVDAATAAPSVSAGVAAAFRLADQVWRQVAADPAVDERTRTAVTGADNWARTALAAYQYLADTGAYAHLDLPAVLRCWANPHQLRGWLTGRSDLPGFTHATVAQSWNIDDDFTWDADAIGTRMATLIDQAQHAGLYGLPDYTITLHQITTDDPDADPIIEHQVTLTTATGARLASAPIAADHLTDDEAGVNAALAVLINTAAVVNELLAAERHLITAGIDVDRRHRRAAHGARPNRGFAPLDLSAAATSPVAIEAAPRPRDPTATRAAKHHPHR